MKNIKIGIIGAGKLGLSLAEAFDYYNLLDWVVDRSEHLKNANFKLRSKKIKIYSSLTEIENLTKILFLTVSDKEIANVSDSLANQFGANLKDKLIVHCSGFLSVDILAKCKSEGAVTIAAHPYQTFYNSSKDLLKGISWGIESEFPIDTISDLIKLTGGNPVKINFKNPEEKALYHCSAVAASNFLTTLVSFSKDLVEKLGLEPNQFIQPIIKTTLENNFSGKDLSENFPLTGPFARGDIQAIKGHIKALEKDSYALKSYCHFGLSTLEFAFQNKLIDDIKYKEINILLTEILIAQKNFISYH